MQVGPFITRNQEPSSVEHLEAPRVCSVASRPLPSSSWDRSVFTVWGEARRHAQAFRHLTGAPQRANRVTVIVLVRYRPAYIVHLQSFDPWLRQVSSWTSPPLDLWKLARWPVAMSVGVATSCEFLREFRQEFRVSSVVVARACFRHHTSNLPSLGGFNSRPRTVFSVVPARAA